MSDEKTARIRALNDRLRRHFIGGRILISSGVRSHGRPFLAKVLGAVQAFDAFTDADDPYSEHDFGALRIDGQTVFFKIDYYDEDLEGGSPDPSDEACCARVLTIMLGEEY